MTFDFSSWPQLHTVSLVNSVTARRSGEGHDGQEREIHVKVEKCCILVSRDKAHKLVFVAHSISEAKLPW